MQKILISLAIVLTAHIPLNASILGGVVVNPANNHSYYLLSPANWTDSQSEALTLGGNLVTVNDAVENAWLFSTFSGVDKPLWLGLTDQTTEGNFAWISGEPFSFSNWSSGEPNNGGHFVHDEDYVYMVESNSSLPLSPGQWNDVPVGGDGILNPVYGVVEIVPEPSIVTLAFIGLCAMIHTRRRPRASQS